MDIRQALLNEPQREQGGKLAVERFEYQAAWGLSRILQLYKSGADFGIAFEFHDDVLELDSMSSPTKVTFFQVKTQKTGTWTLSSISASSGTKGKKTAVKPGEPPPDKKLSFAAKMYDNYKRFPDHTERLVFVTNQMCSDLVAGHGETKFEAAAAAKVESFRKRLKEQDPEFQDEHSKLFHFCCSTMNLASFSDTIMGAVQKFVIEQTGMTETSTYAFGLMLLEECRQRERMDVDFSSFSAMSESFVTRKLIDDRLEDFKRRRKEAVEWSEIAPSITNIVRRRDIGAAWRLYVNDRRSRYGPGPQRFRKAVKDVAAKHIAGARDLLTEVDAALPEVRELADMWDKTATDDYIRAVILYEFHDV
ncbi:dsDNA nuclease domain-containing protein [Mesorhizobium sp. VK25A]|uniref:DsDNA nuclease domain-containing protein n=1 Tax=Mesorhizobium vachelliae TaxID=3072309 RepID=A0ABU5A838_9HYPH|nr:MULTISPECIES: dsDNA nuclease domain-containing protein [unclassified Mesorhizobium]MDX8532782.1 dsDNA nuclease domain-containing protein [Mesorhizobium sp. VK25D]MDX8544712.1 dsDNA nuclease domain-containing protein [Mesorhizobium sp. VK25A]